MELMDAQEKVCRPWGSRKGEGSGGCKARTHSTFSSSSLPRATKVVGARLGRGKEKKDTVERYVDRHHTGLMPVEASFF